MEIELENIVGILQLFYVLSNAQVGDCFLELESLAIMWQNGKGCCETIFTNVELGNYYLASVKHVSPIHYLAIKLQDKYSETLHNVAVEVI